MLKQKCNKCGKTKSINDFYLYKKTIDSPTQFRPRCKECSQNKWKEWSKTYGREEYLEGRRKKYYENRDELLQKKKEWHKKLRLEALNHYSNGNLECACCKENKLEFLVLDHENGGGNKHRREINKRLIYVWMKQNNYPKGFRILCHNCNYSLGSLKYCPHQKI